ncbi:uncharacterized protein B0T15DRAFT_486780 [Chaetomium strumarium]|uniref:Zinc finger Mcm10/DnaG-type domain-containing protein n=1 Tax=Chaetomium strumarium TaxID=1170767 RepID=A0AAJ0GNS5_9PEZI|nr:hypothetical protein B0T15DRAFT_486780 [Chaetomium strumarium]
MAAQWPPRSPHEALLSTPGGREKLRRIEERSSPSLSPSRLRASRSVSALGPRSGAGASAGEDALFEGGDDDEEEDDEETLQLKLQAIQARLKLKKLRAAKAQGRSTAASKPHPGDGGAMKGLPMQSKLAAVRDRMEKQASRDIVQVPASPVKKALPPPEQTSPQRIVLGIDKGLRGADVSLKRAPSQRSARESQPSQQGSYLRRAKSPLDSQIQQEARPMSFNERLASARTEEVARRERRERAEKVRKYKAKALELPDLPSKFLEFSREQILSSMGGSSGAGQLQRSNTAPNVRAGARVGNFSNASTTTTSAVEDTDPGGGFEPYSGLHLSKRILPHNVLARAVSGKKAYLLKDLLRQIKAPDWSLPDDETDIVVHRPGPGSDGKSQQDRGKYMVITLVDLTYEVDLFLFNSGFDRFWKLTPGTVLAILNPGILPPPPGREATNRFGLVINSDEDTILEIGNARDIGYCKSIKKDGTYCKSWVNARRTEYCDARIEMSTTVGLGGGGGERWKHNSRRIHAKSEEEKQRGQYDRATHSQYFISTAHRAADPDDERLSGMADRKEREEALKLRLAQREKERDIARRLAEAGGGAGREYMSRAAGRITTTTTTTTTSTNTTAGSSFSSAPSSSLPSSSSFSSAAPISATTSASSIAPLGWGAQLKDKLGRMKGGERLDGRDGANMNGGLSGAAGGSGSTGVPSLPLPPPPPPPSEGAAARGDKSPVRKKTRFVTEKGIREAGRDSLGEPMLSAAVKTRLRRQVVPLGDDDDDDDLIIVR